MKYVPIDGSQCPECGKTLHGSWWSDTKADYCILVACAAVGCSFGLHEMNAYTGVIEGLAWTRKNKGKRKKR